MNMETLKAEIIVQTNFTETDAVTFILASYEDDNRNERYCIAMSVGDKTSLLATYDDEVTFDIAASAFWAQTQGQIVDGSDRAHDSIYGPKETIIIPDTDTVQGINKEKQ